MRLFQPGESEAQTRRQRIDPRLEKSGWRVVPFGRGVTPENADGRAIAEYPTENGPADYALCAGGAVLGVVEAKKLTVGPQNVLTQAERYSRGVQDSPFTYSEGFRVPFLYATNGEVTWFHDIRDPLNRSRKVAGFHTPEALKEMLARDTAGTQARLDALPFTDPHIRPYQREASLAVEKAIKDRKRKQMVVMATGTGKTRTTVNQVYRLMKSGVAKRILFLVDRRALAAQTVRAFASFEAEPGLKFNKAYEVYSQRFSRGDLDSDDGFDENVLPQRYLTDPQPGHAFVYVSTIQRMAINLFGKQAVFEGGDRDAEETEAEKLNIPIHAFDMIIADEYHRGYSAQEVSLWRDTLDHFDAVKVGLTATPAAHTMAYFENIVFRYTYEQAVKEGYLVDFDVVNVKSNVRIEGVKLAEGEHVARIDTQTGQQQMDFLEDEVTYSSSDIEAKITAPDSNRKILEEIKQYAEAHEAETGRFPKTLIFAANDLPHTSHADQLVDLARDVFGKGDAFVAKVTGRVDRPLQRIKEFRNRPQPKIVVSVDMLTTGVDIPDLEFIVFLRPVKSRILFEQMLGRGTRRADDLAPPKSHFTVFDCFDGTLLAAFRDKSAMAADALVKESKTIREVIEAIWNNVERDYNVRSLVKRLQRIDKKLPGAAREQFSAYIPDGDLARFADGLPAALKADFTGTMKLLRDDGFLDLLINYPRPERTFVYAPNVQDEVSSEKLIREGGKEYKPADYLEEFSRFVQANAHQIEALRILLDKPDGWNTDALKTLRAELRRAHFPEEKVREAHAIAGHKALADVISMVQHTADAGRPLLTAEERVRRAVTDVVGEMDLTPEQEQWLGYIKASLIENLIIEKDDFDDVPALANRGGWNRANKVSGGMLENFL
jgi:type I restriction enzyme, R subunit